MDTDRAQSPVVGSVDATLGRGVAPMDRFLPVRGGTDLLAPEPAAGRLDPDGYVDLWIPTAPPPLSASRPDSPRAHHWLTVVTLLVVATLVLGVALAIGLGGRIDRTDRQLGAVRAHLHQTLARVHQAEHDLASVSGQSASAGQTLASETSQLDSAQAQLASTESNVHANGVSINELVTCLAGVERALNQISLSDQRGAAASLDSVAAACRAAAPSS